ncbi:MAG TPA: sulfite oxidase-like oxidoreductase [Steroidobacteraceae bacterium]|jgi:DMSO/TMAO reductase YedYZ molybdopterin-dependent catalytic subunit|nr:MAG: sulfite oxidase-like oxidoreductase [Betaproteobacteria bacterium]HWS61660.1 sulfite oxidase-like oxidoreductase [Steroidobacteraceae bacterium]
MTTRGFFGRRPSDEVAQRLPPGQHPTEDFPVLAKGPTPSVDPAIWRFTIHDGSQLLAQWTWAQFETLPQTVWRGDIHCVTKWSKLDTTWSGVTIDDLFQSAGVTPPSAYLLAESHDDYDTNLPVADLLGGKAMIATRFAGAPLAAEHGGPARLLVPHLYFWKSAKWIKGLRFTARDEAGFWEQRGYHMYGDPWREQRYTNDP